MKLLELADTLRKPEYFFRPSQILKRLRLRSRSETEVVTLPWGLRLTVSARDAIGVSILKSGVFDLAVTEALWRLAVNSRVVVDAGANIGYMTSIVACNTPSHARIFAFEPHPLVFEELRRNIDHWPVSFQGKVVMEASALSSQKGESVLFIPPDFIENRGIATLENSGDENSTVVQTETLDAFVSGAGVRTIDLLKVDVEGHEEKVMLGAAALLREGRIKNIVFEDHAPPLTSRVIEMLRGFGYSVFHLRKAFFGPLLFELAHTSFSRYDAPSYVAGLDRDLLVRTFHGRGWKSLQQTQG